MVAENKHLGQVYDLKDVPAKDYGGNKVTVTGRYEVVEYEQEDRSAGILDSYFILCPQGIDDDGWEESSISVDPWDFLEAVDPEYAAKMRKDEEEWEIAMALEQSEGKGSDDHS